MLGSTCSHTYTHAQIHVHTHSHTQTHIHAHAYTQSNTHTHTPTHAHTLTYTHTHSITLTHTHTHIHTHCHTHVRTSHTACTLSYMTVSMASAPGYWALTPLGAWSNWSIASPPALLHMFVLPYIQTELIKYTKSVIHLKAWNTSSTFNHYMSKYGRTSYDRYNMKHHCMIKTCNTK